MLEHVILGLAPVVDPWMVPDSALFIVAINYTCHSLMRGLAQHTLFFSRVFIMAALAKPQATTFPLAEHAAQRPRPVTHCPFPQLTSPLSLAAVCRRTCSGAACVHIRQRWTWASLGAAVDRHRDRCLSSARGERGQGCALTDACSPE